MTQSRKNLMIQKKEGRFFGAISLNIKDGLIKHWGTSGECGLRLVVENNSPINGRKRKKILAQYNVVVTCGDLLWLSLIF